MPTADLGDVSLYYERHGEGPPVLGIMGFGADQRLWAAQIPAVTRTHTFITFDNRGVGRSSGNGASTIDQMADDAFRLLGHLDSDRTVIFGASMGGAIAQRLVLDHPEIADALILAVTFARPIEFMRRQHELTRAILRTESPLDAFIDGAVLRMFTPAFFELGRETVDRIVRGFLAGDEPMTSPEVLLAQLDALDKHDLLAELPSIDCPTLVLGGKQDVMVPGFASEEIARAIPGAELHMFETGHGCLVEEMDQVNARISDFLARL